jgi:hypothetical protein
MTVAGNDGSRCCRCSLHCVSLQVALLCPYPDWPDVRSWRKQTCGSVALTLPKQLRRPREVDGDPPGLVVCQNLRLSRFGLVVAGIDVGKCLPVGVSDDVTACDLVSTPGRREAA